MNTTRPPVTMPDSVSDDGIAFFDAPLFDIEVDMNDCRTTVRLTGGGAMIETDGATLRHLARVLDAAADYAGATR